MTVNSVTVNSVTRVSQFGDSHNQSTNIFRPYISRCLHLAANLDGDIYVAPERRGAETHGAFIHLQGQLSLLPHTNQLPCRRTFLDNCKAQCLLLPLTFQRMHSLTIQCLSQLAHLTDYSFYSSLSKLNFDVFLFPCLLILTSSLFCSPSPPVDNMY